LALPRPLSGPLSAPGPRRLVIERLGARGDGIAQDEAGREAGFVTGALPGEVVEAAGDGEAPEPGAILTASPERTAPICRFFGACGGCVIQHASPALQAEWKRGLVAQALERAGIAATINPLLDGHGEGRRRVTLHGRRREAESLAGFMRARSHELIAIDHCPILEARLARAPAIATALTGALAASAKPLTILVTATENGLDVDVRGNGPPSEKQRIGLTQLASQLDLARLSIHGDTIVARREPTQRMGRALVTIPPGGFLQPTLAGEALLGRLAMEAVAGAKRVADLFAGSGPFALRLAETAEVTAYESEEAALVALDKAARATPGLRRVLTERRDLFRRPLLPLELKGFDAVVLDPPRAGSEAQCVQLAQSSVPRIAYISCDVGSFARDAALLLKGGYQLDSVTPVDQFRHSAHVELVGILSKARPRAARR
jgi:23S rRNA (uracil1939-C5)-methyltransferase